MAFLDACKDEKKQMKELIVPNKLMVIVENVDFIHRTPMTVLPAGALTEIDCDSNKITILESGCV